MPRPKKQPEETRRRIIKFRVDDAEFSLLEKEAKPAGLSVHERAREKAVAASATASGRRLREQQETPGAFEMRQLLLRAGNNLNQIARKLNALGEHKPAELVDAAKHLDELFLRMLAGSR